MENVRNVWAVVRARDARTDQPILFPVDMLEDAKEYARENGMFVYPGCVVGNTSYHLTEKPL